MKVFVNTLTILRLFGTFIIPFLFRVLPSIVLLIIILFILLTDFFDGFLARKFNVQTLFGTILDTIADKCFGIMILILLAIYNKWFIIPLILELSIAIINLSGSILGATTKSSFLGKTKMWFLGISALFGFMYALDLNIIGYINDNISSIMLISISITSGCEIMVIVDYARHILKELKLNKKNNKKIKYNFKDKDDLYYALFNTEFCLKHKDEPISKQLLK